MTKISYKVWKQSFPFICLNCKNLLNAEREFCEFCGKAKFLRETNRKDYKAKFKKVKEL